MLLKTRDRNPMSIAKALMTAREFARSGPATDGFELVRGELVPMPPPKRKHGLVRMNVGFLLKAYTKALGHGDVLINDTGLITETGPDTVRGVDVMLYLKPGWSEKDSPDDYLREPPDLTVEVRSPDQAWKAILEKVTEYLQMGVRLVWVIDPQVERVHVFRPDREPEVLAADNQLDGGDVLPGFLCAVAELFAI